VPRLVNERADVLPVLAEVFREHGFDGASLSVIGQRTGLGKGSLYHFFPGGKDEMATAVLSEIDEWFKTNIFRPLQDETDPHRAINRMLQKVEDYFQSGRRVCLIGAFALGETRDRFARPLRAYFATWRDSLAGALVRTGRSPKEAKDLAEDAVASIQGALVLARALKDPESFQRAISRAKIRLLGDRKRRPGP
jgi:TetR/AcrR family transcriptional regulator, lmrAB and yxaGH operons repressor